LANLLWALLPGVVRRMANKLSDVLLDTAIKMTLVIAGNLRASLWQPKTFLA
jgi:hypothetical protein